MFRLLVILQFLIHSRSFTYITKSSRLLFRQSKYYDDERGPLFESSTSLAFFRRRRGGRGALEPPSPPPPEQAPQQQPVIQQQRHIDPRNPNLGSNIESPATTTNSFSQKRDMIGKMGPAGRASRRVTLRRYLNGLVKKHPEVSSF